MKRKLDLPQVALETIVQSTSELLMKGLGKSSRSSTLASRLVMKKIRKLSAVMIKAGSSRTASKS